jgi:hypothetical protein
MIPIHTPTFFLGFWKDTQSEEREYFYGGSNTTDEARAMAIGTMNGRSPSAKWESWIPGTIVYYSNPETFKAELEAVMPKPVVESDSQHEPL